MIQSLLWLIDPDHRRKESISDQDDKKFTHIVDTSFGSDFGTADRLVRTVPYRLWEVRTKSHRLLAADRHRVVKAGGSVVWIENLKVGDFLNTDYGPQQVVSVRDLGVSVHMYCLCVNADGEDDHLYYTDGILSHNTEVTVGYLLWYAMFHPNATILIAGNIYRAALEIMRRIRFTYERLPDYIRAGAVSYQKGSIEFDNGSTILSQATTESTGRGLAISILYCDEFAFVPPRLAEDFWGAISPTLSAGGKCFITSTPNSDVDTFAQIWHDAVNTFDEFGNEIPHRIGRNGFRAIKVTWDAHPDRDEVWAEAEKMKVGEIRFRREHNCEFITADDTLIDGICLANLRGREPLYKTENEVRWYKEIEPNMTYLFGLDPCSGVGRDAAAVQVYEYPTMQQVGEWRHNETPVKDQVGMLLTMLNHVYRKIKKHPRQMGEPEIYWTVEVNGGYGDAALTVIDDTGEEHFPGEFVHEPHRRGMRRVRRGLYTTGKSKVASCIRLKSYIESRRLAVNSKQLVHELKFFVAKGRGFEAKHGQNDDLVTASLLIVRMVEIIQRWDPEFSSQLLETVDFDDEDGSIEPMPMAMII